jgi:short-subunit dehydrogenase
MGMLVITIAVATKLNISLIGKHGDLATALNTRLIQDHIVTCYSQNDYNFLNKHQVSQLADTIHDSDIIICCPGIVEADMWDMVPINSVAPIYLLEKLLHHKSTSHFIMIGSHGAMWTSWPGITLNRLTYNISKGAIQSFITGLDQSNITKMPLSIVNLSKYKSKNSGYTGYPVDLMVQSIVDVIENPKLVTEFGSYKSAD